MRQRGRTTKMLKKALSYVGKPNTFYVVAINFKSAETIAHTFCALAREQGFEVERKDRFQYSINNTNFCFLSAANKPWERIEGTIQSTFIDHAARPNVPYDIQYRAEIED